MDEFVKSMQAHSKKSLMPLQKRILIAYMSIANLLNDIKTHYGMEYIITQCLN